MLHLSRLRLCRRSSPRRWNETKAIHPPGSTHLQRRTLYEVHDTTSPTAQTRYGSGDSGVWEAEKNQWQRRRRLKDHDFVDHIIIAVAAGKGGNGCVAFHRPSSPRSPRNPYRLGPPSGGNGGRGGDIYLLPDESLTSLASVPRRVKGKPGSSGSGEWRNGRNGKDKVVRVPKGTVVKVVGWGYKPIPERYYAFGEIGRSSDRAEETTTQMKWVHYPGWAEANMKREEFKEAEKWLEKEESRRMQEGRKKWGLWVKEGREIDLDAELMEEQEVVDTVNEPLGKKRKELLGYLFASGGAGGLGNPHFCVNLNSSTSASSASAAAFARSPKFATRGVVGEVLTLSLELKTNADVALVGRCNVGKSTLIRALTGGRVKSDVGGWEGVTRGVVRGVVRVAQGEGEEQGEGRVWEGELGGVRVFDESMKVRDGKRRLEAEDDEEFSPVPTKPGHGFDLYESFRFTITDNPGFVLPKTRSGHRQTQPEHEEEFTSEEEELAPITQTILRSIERAKVLVYVVDLSGDAPWDELRDVIREVARGRGGSEDKSQTRKPLVVANKADLLVGSEGAEAEVAEAQAKLRRLEEYVKQEIGDGLEVVPVSAKWGMNLGRVVRSLEGLLLKARGIEISARSD